MNRSLRAFAASISAAALVGAAPLAVQAAGAVTFIQAVEPAGLDPTVGSPVAAGQVTWQNIFEGLVTIDRDGALQPQLATDWEISPDGLTYTFHLRDGVTFHNGVPFDSEVAKFSLDRLLAAESTNGQKALFTVIERVEAPEPGRLVLHVSQPASDLLYWLGFPAAVMVEPGSADSNTRAPWAPVRSSLRTGGRVTGSS